MSDHKNMPTPETDARVQKVSRYSNVPGGPRIEIVPAEVSRRLERRLAVQTALAESLAAKAQELRLLVERTMLFVQHSQGGLLGRCGVYHARLETGDAACTCGLGDLRAEIRERKE